MSIKRPKPKKKWRREVAQGKPAVIHPQAIKAKENYEKREELEKTEKRRDDALGVLRGYSGASLARIIAAQYPSPSGN